MRTQVRHVADRDGRTQGGLRAGRAEPFVFARGRLRVAGRAVQIPDPVVRRRRPVQRVLPVEGLRRVHRHPVLLPAMRRVARRERPDQALPERQRLVARARSK